MFQPKPDVTSHAQVAGLAHWLINAINISFTLMKGSINPSACLPWLAGIDRFGRPH